MWIAVHAFTGTLSVAAMNPVPIGASLILHAICTVLIERPLAPAIEEAGRSVEAPASVRTGPGLLAAFMWLIFWGFIAFLVAGLIGLSLIAEAEQAHGQTIPPISVTWGPTPLPPTPHPAPTANHPQATYLPLVYNQGGAE